MQKTNLKMRPIAFTRELGFMHFAAHGFVRGALCGGLSGRKLSDTKKAFKSQTMGAVPHMNCGREERNENDYEEFRQQQWRQMRRNLHGNWLGPIEKFATTCGRIDLVDPVDQGEAHYVVSFNDDQVSGTWEGKKVLEKGRPSEYIIPLHFEKFSAVDGVFNLPGITGQSGIVRSSSHFIIEVNFVSADGCRRMLVLMFAPVEKNTQDLKLLSVTWCGFRDQNANSVPAIDFDLTDLHEVNLLLRGRPSRWVGTELSTAKGASWSDDLYFSGHFSDWQSDDRLCEGLKDGLFMSLPKRIRSGDRLILGVLGKTDKTMQVLEVSLDAANHPVSWKTAIFGEYPVR